MSRVSRDSWKPGAVWRNIDPSQRGNLEAIIVAPSRTGRKNYKLIRMNYIDGHYKDRPILQEYSHAHMLRYFLSTGERQDVTQWLNCSHDDGKDYNSHCSKCGGDK